MNSTGELIHFFAQSGYLRAPEAISYLKVHNPAEIRELFDELMPDTLVIDVPLIRQVKHTSVPCHVSCHDQET